MLVGLPNHPLEVTRSRAEMLARDVIPVIRRLPNYLSPRGGASAGFVPLRLGPVTDAVYAVVRGATPALRQDRPTGPDAAAAHDALCSSGSVDAVRGLLGENHRD